MRKSFIRPAIASISSLALIAAGFVFQPSPPAAEARTATALENVFDYAAKFDGYSHLAAQANNAVIPGTGAFTVEAWIKPDAPSTNGAYQMIVTQNQSVGAAAVADRFVLALQSNNGSFKLRYAHGATEATEIAASPGDGIPANAWSHVALTVGATPTAPTRLYLNGQLVGELSTSDNPISAAPFTIGATGQTTPSLKFKGEIDQVKVWDGELSSSDLQTSMHSWSSEGVTGKTLRAHFDFNDKTAAAGTIFNKVSGSPFGYHLNMTGTLAFPDVKSYQEINGTQQFTFPRTYLTEIGGWQLPAGTSQFSALVVGAGGGGGADGGGGGGGGEINQASSFDSTMFAKVAIKVGQGGTGGRWSSTISTASTAGQTSVIASTTGTTLLSAIGGGGGGSYTAAGGIGGTGGVGLTRTAGAAGPDAVPTSSSTALEAGKPGINGTLSALSGLVYGSSGGSGFGIYPDAPTNSATNNAGGDGAGSGAIVEAVGDGSTGFSGAANRGGGGGGGVAGGYDAGKTDGVKTRTDGGNGGSGVVVISINFVAKCMFGASGYVISQSPKVRFFPLGGVTDPDVRLFNSGTITAAFYGQPVVVGDRLYIADRGSSTLKSMTANAQGTNETHGTLNSPGIGVTTDGRYVYAWNSTGVARYDTQTGVYQQTFIGKGDIANVDGEIEFARVNGIGYLFLGNANGTTLGTQYSRIHAVPVSGPGVVVPTTLSDSAHLFSESRLTGGNASQRGSSGLAVVGDTLYWSTFANTVAESAIWKKTFTSTNLPGFPGATVVRTAEADAVILENQKGLRTLSADSQKLYFQNVSEVKSYSFSDGVVNLENVRGTEMDTANGTQPTATCPLPPYSVGVRTSSTSLELGWYAQQTTGSTQYVSEYRVNGGDWVAIAKSRDIVQNVTPPAGNGLIEFRVATEVLGQLGEFVYSRPATLGVLPEPPLCSNPTKMTFEVAARTAITIPLGSLTSTTVSIAWGDGQTNAPTRFSGDSFFRHTYLSAGTYNVDICGTFSSIGHSSTTQPNLTSVGSWGEAATTLVELDFAFLGASRLTDVPATLPANVTSLSGTFRDATIFNDPDVLTWETQNVTNFNATFSSARAFNQPINTNGNYWNTSSATRMTEMFYNAESFNQNISDWDTSKVTNTSSMFYGTKVFNQPLTTNGVKWDMSKVTNFTFMFGVSGFNQPLSTWVTTSAESMANMFYQNRVFNQDVSNFNTANVINLSGMFNGARAFNNGSSDLIKDWNTAKVTNMSFMFYGADNFNQPVNTDGSKWDVSNVTDMSFMFGFTSAFNQPLNWNTAKVTNMRSMFHTAKAFNNTLDFEIDSLTEATDMLSFSGLSDQNYGTVMLDFEAQHRAGGAKNSVPFGASGKTAFCLEPHAAVLYLISTAGWRIGDKTNKTATATYCVPTVTITAASATHVYGEPVPAIGFTKAVTGTLPTSDWLSQVECKPVTTAGAAVTSTSAAGTGYKTTCTGPLGTGLGIKIIFVDGTYSISKRPITVQAKNRVSVTDKAPIAFGDTSSGLVETDDYMITAGTIAPSETLQFTLSNAAPVAENVYSTAGVTAINIAAKSGSATASNYDVTSIAGNLTVSLKKYVVTAKSLTKQYGDVLTFNTATGWVCETNDAVSCDTELAGKVTLESLGAAKTAVVGTYDIVTGTNTASSDYEIVNTNGGVLKVVKRKLTVTPNAMTVPYGSSVPTHTFTITGFADGEGVGNLPPNYAPTCTSGYNPDTPRGTVLPITCTGGNAGTNYEFVSPATTPTLTVPALSTVASDVPVEINLPESEIGTEVAFKFDIQPVSQICVANLVISTETGDIQTLSQEVVPGALTNFGSRLDIGGYNYELIVDGNCSIPNTRGFVTINGLVPEPTVESGGDSGGGAVAPLPYSGPIVTEFSDRELTASKGEVVTIKGQRLNLVTDAWVGDTKITFSRNAQGDLILNLPAMLPGTYDLRLGFSGGGVLTHIAAFRVLPVGVPETEEPVIEALPKTTASKTLRYTNFSGDKFSLPLAARNGITRTVSRIDDVTRVVCRGFTSASRITTADQALARQRAKAACDLARRSAPDAVYELRTSPAAGVGARFRAVNLFIVYNLD